MTTLHLTGQPIPTSDHSFKDDVSPLIQRESPMPQLSSSPSALSKNHRRLEVPQEVTKSNPPAKAGTLQHVTQEGVHVGLEYFH